MTNFKEHDGMLFKQPKPTFKVGDWVEIDFKGKLSHRQVVSVHDNGIRVKLVGVSSLLSFDGKNNIVSMRLVRKLKPSEVVIQIGCLSGTVRCCENEFICPESTPNNPCHFVLQNQITGFWSIIYFKMLDAPTRELVQSLLKAQIKEKEQEEK